MTFPLFQRIFSEFSEGENPIAPVIKFANNSLVRGLRMGRPMDRRPETDSHSPRRRLEHILLGNKQSHKLSKSSMKPRGASFLTALLSLHYEDNCGRRATKSRDNSFGFTFSAATGGSFNRCYKLDNNRLGPSIIISPSTWRDSGSCGPGTLELSLTQRQILAGFRSKQASRLPIANGRESSDLASLRGASRAVQRRRDLRLAA